MNNLRAAYPGGEASLRAPKEEFGQMMFEKTNSLGNRTKVQSKPSAAARGVEAWRRNA